MAETARYTTYQPDFVLYNRPAWDVGPLIDEPAPSPEVLEHASKELNTREAKRKAEVQRMRGRW